MKLESLECTAVSQTKTENAVRLEKHFPSEKDRKPVVIVISNMEPGQVREYIPGNMYILTLE